MVTNKEYTSPLEETRDKLFKKNFQNHSRRLKHIASAKIFST